MAIFAQGKLVWIEATKKNLHDLNQVLLKILSVAVYEVSESLEHVLLVVMAGSKSRGMELNQL